MSDIARFIGGAILVIIGLSAIFLLPLIFPFLFMLILGIQYNPSLTIIFSLSGVIIGIIILGAGIFYIITSMKRDSHIIQKQETVIKKSHEKTKPEKTDGSQFCHKCGEKMKEGAKFCHKCGEKVD